MDDEAIIELYFARSERAIQETDAKYGPACRALSRQIVGDRRDAEECVNDAYLGAWNAIPPARPHPLLTFLCKIVRHISISRWRANAAQKRSGAGDVPLEELAECLPSAASVEDAVETEELTRLLDRFLEGLSREDRVIFLRRYWFCDSYARIAARTGLTEKNVSVRLARVRRRLKNYLTEQGVFS